MEYKETGEGQKRFSVSGNIWDYRHRDIIAGGQCLDEIAEYLDDPTFLEIYRLWKLYHLNDLHAECKHQAAAGWREVASTEVPLYHWTLTQAALKKQSEAKETELDALKQGKVFTPTKTQQFFSSLNYSLTTSEETLQKEIAEHYEPKSPLYLGDQDHIEFKQLGWMTEKEHPQGILNKACPVCGYKYGSSWNYFPIPEEDEKIIYKLLEIGRA